MKHIFKFVLVTIVFQISQAYGGNEMEVVNLESIQIQGIGISTSNDAEMNSGKPVIPDLWDRFYNDHYGKTLNGSPVYGVYTNYESDVNGQYSVIAGVKKEGDNKAYRDVVIKPGKYLVFTKEGASTDAVIAAWQLVWEYFADASKPYKRAYTTDFEVYEGSSEVSVYIAVK